jgi:HAD superfamily hydrolase (TIGR01509 family)
MDGTLVDNMAYHTRSWLELFAELKVEMTADRLERLMGSRTTPELLRHLLGRQISEQDIAAHAERKEVIYRAMYGPHLKAVEGVGQFLQKAQALGFSLALATSAGGRNIEFILSGLGIDGCFDVIIGGDDVPQGKSGPEIYLTAAARLAVSPAQCLVFEDSRSGIEAAYLAGMKVIVVATNAQADELRAQPAVIDVVSDFRGLEPANLVHMIGPAGERGAAS